jgi:hypothetical protein
MEDNAFIYLEFIRKVMATLPGAAAGSSYGTPGFHVQKKFLARLWESGEVLVVRTEEREKWMAKDPEVFFFTEHYRNYPAVLVNLPKVDPEDLEALLIESWMGRASKNLLNQYKLRLD